MNSHQFTLPQNNFNNSETAVIVDTSVASITYICRAQPGTAESEATWQVFKIDETDPTKVMITWADGNSKFDNVAADRLTLTYS